MKTLVHFQREIGFDAGGKIELAGVKQRPAAVSALDAAEIDADLAFKLGIDAIEEMFQQQIFGGDGGICLEFENEVPIGLLQALE